MLGRMRALLALGILCTWSVCAAAQSGRARSNFVLILADDCTVWDVGCYGGQARTPNIDRLAREGMRFKRCFQAAPMCSPTRHNLLTGLWPVTTGAYPNHTRVRRGTKSAAHYFRQAGYRVGMSGKRHIAPKASFPFEDLGKKDPDFTKISGFMRDCVSKEEAFCLFACSREPHSPWNKGDVSKYPADKLRLPPYFVDTPATRESFRRYLAEVSVFDDQVGRILGLLAEHGVERETIVVVLSEQGSSLPFAKWTCYGMGLQSACVVRWPGVVEAGSTSDALVEYIDILPTFLEAASIDRPTALQGKSFVDVLRGRATEHKRYSFGLMTTRGIKQGAETYGIRTVFDGRFRYIWNLSPERAFRNACTQSTVFREWRRAAREGDAGAAELVKRYTRRPEIELYDVEADRFESRNLAGKPEFAGDARRLREQLEAWMKLCVDAGQATELSALEHQTGRRGRALTALERDQRGDAFLKAGFFREAIADFDAFLAARPELEAQHWRRGIAFYYAGEFAKGVRQFEVHRGVNPADVENAAWHFLCKARLSGVEAARAALLPCKPDARVPMMTVYELFRGAAKPEDVLRAARAPRAARQAEAALFYAHLYLGLYAEALGQKKRAKRHLDLAAREHTSPYYMGDVARMHARRLRR